MKMPASLVTTVAALALSTAVFAQAPPPVEPAPGASLLAIATNPAQEKLTVSTPGWKDGEDIPFKYTQYQGNEFPGWSGARGRQRPSPTQSSCRTALS